MKKTGLLTLLPLLLSAFPLSSCGNNDLFRPESEIKALGYEKIPFSWTVGDNETGHDYFYYKDSFFAQPASELDLAFVNFGYAWAVANFSCYTFTGDYSRQTENAEALAASLGFDSFEANSYFKEKPNVYTIGLSCAKKKLTLDGNECTALLLGIRGARYEAEWGSNFTLGKEGDHPGFSAAADTAIEYVNEYIDKHNITGNVKIMVSGYSRAAATTNLFSGKIDTALSKGESLLSEKVSYDKDDIYAFCFEPPAGANLENYELHSETYSNIHCFINPNDLVPLVAPIDYRFARFGNQYFYPNSTTTLDYKEREAKMLYFLSDMLKTGHKKYGGYAIDSFVPHAPDEHGSFFAKDTGKINWSVELQVRHLISTLATFGLKNRSNFFDTVQTGIINTIQLVYERGPNGEDKPFSLVSSALIKELLNLKLSKSLIDDLTIEELHPFFANDFTPFLIRAFHSAMPDIELKTIQEIASGLSGVVVGFAEVAFVEPGLIASLVDMHNIAAVTHAHYPEINYFWIKAMNPLIYKEPIPAQFDRTWSMLSVDGVDKVEVKDSKGELVMKIENDKPVDLKSNYTYGIRKIYGQPFYEFYFPGEEEYTIDIHCKERNLTSWSFNYYDAKAAMQKPYYNWDMTDDGDKNIQIKLAKLY